MKVCYCHLETGSEILTVLQCSTQLNTEELSYLRMPRIVVEFKDVRFLIRKIPTQVQLPSH